jgi:hypothetical protein
MAEFGSVISGMKALRRDNPWPHIPEGLEPFYFALDGGGRDIITSFIQRHKVKLLVEIGSFLCGSTRMWLDAYPELEVIAVDPWEGNWAPYLQTLLQNYPRLFQHVKDPEAIINQVHEYGNYINALNNLRGYEHRVIPIRRYSPEALQYLRRRYISPGMIYIDAFKSADDLYVANELFPTAILSGDDWTWPNSKGEFQMRENVKEFAAAKGFVPYAQAQTWILWRAVPTAVKGA